jgi:hypothetical protein
MRTTGPITSVGAVQYDVLPPAEGQAVNVVSFVADRDGRCAAFQLGIVRAGRHFACADPYSSFPVASFAVMNEEGVTFRTTFRIADCNSESMTETVGIVGTLGGLAFFNV